MMAPLKVQYFAWTAIQINGEWSTYVLKYFFERDQVVVSGFLTSREALKVTDVSLLGQKSNTVKEQYQSLFLVK